MKSILEQLKKSKVFCITKNKNSTFLFDEMCDYYYDDTLTKNEMLQLANEIKELANSQ